MHLSELEVGHVIAMLDQLMAELEQSEEVSAEAVDGVIEIYEIFGVKYDGKD